MSLNYITLILDLYDGDGTPVTTGQAVATPTSLLTDPEDQEYIPQATASVLFGAGNPPLRLLAVDSSGPRQSGWGWTLAFRNVPGNPPSVTVQPAAGPVDFTASDGDPCTISWTPTSMLTGIPDGSGVQLAGDGLPGGFTAGVMYYVVGSAEDTLQLAATSGGAPIASTSTGSGSLTVVQYHLSALSQAEAAAQFQSYMPEPSGTPAPGDVPIVQENGSVAWEAGGGGGGGAVSSVFGRTGNVTAQSGDYTAAEVGADASGTAAAAQTTAESFATSAVGTETTRAETAEAAAESAAETYAAGVASTAQGNAETFASGAVGTETSRAEAAEALRAPLASAALTGAPTAPTQSTGDTSTKIATDAFVAADVATETSRAETAEGTMTTAVAGKVAKAGDTMTGKLSPTVTTVAFVSAVTLPVTTNVLSLTLTGACTVNAPSSGNDGDLLRVRIIGANSHAVTWGTGWDWGTAGAPTLAGPRDRIVAEYVASATVWDAAADLGH